MKTDKKTHHAIFKWGVLYQKQESKTGTSSYIPQYLWDVITLYNQIELCVNTAVINHVYILPFHLLIFVETNPSYFAVLFRFNLFELWKTNIEKNDAILFLHEHFKRRCLFERFELLVNAMYCNWYAVLKFLLKPYAIHINWHLWDHLFTDTGS